MSNIDKLGIDKLRFFTGDGKEIITEKQYSLEWEIVPSKLIYSSFIKNPKGHFELNLVDDPTVNEEKLVNVVVDEPGLIKSSATFYRTICDEDSLYSCLETSSSLLSNSKNYSRITASFTNATYTITDLLNILFFSYRMSNEYLLSNNVEYGKYSNVINNITKDNDINYYSFVCDVTTDNRIKIIHNENYIALCQSTEGTVLTLSSTATALNIPFDGKLYISFKKTDANFKLYRIDDLYESNELVITIHNGSETATSRFNVVDILQTTTERSVASNFISYNSYVPNEDFLTESSLQQALYGITDAIFVLPSLNVSLFDVDLTNFTSASNPNPNKSNISVAYYLFSENVNREQYPYVKYIGNVMLNKVSANFIDSTTIIVVNEETDESGNKSFSYPIVEDTDDNKTYQMHFKFLSDSEMSFITSNDNVELIKRQSMFMSMLPQVRNASTFMQEAMHFTVGFESDTEGCYQNTLGMFIRDIATDVDYFIGLIIFNTEVIDEDLRYRTMFTNFGIPDPINYPNIFRNQDPDEELTDWTIINDKSKELFLEYDLIFPYVGTYKALFKAIKYLGYQDIIFKEWYKIKDSAGLNKFVAIQNYDTSTGLNIANVLKNYGVEFGEYERYTKLNRLSMIYHMQRMSEDESEEKLDLFNNSGAVQPNTSYYNHNDIPSQYNVYEYRTDEVLAKLYSVKKWLERYITGVNCYISDINGEGLIIERSKTIGYVTEHWYKDVQNRGYFTPNTHYTNTIFSNSQATITCSLNEFDKALVNPGENVEDDSYYTNLISPEHRVSNNHSGITFETYKDYTIEQFIKQQYDVSVGTGSNVTDETIYVSCPLGAITVADEYEFLLSIDRSDNGSLYEFTDSDNTPIVLKDGELTFFDNKKSSTTMSGNNAPIINIRKGNIRQVSGSWSADSITNTNIIYTISQVIGEIEGTDISVYYLLSDLRNPNNIKTMRCNSAVTLTPDAESYLKYDANNQWQVPLLFIKGYNVTSLFKNISSDLTFDNSSTEYIIEIIDGDIRFANSNKTVAKQCDGAILSFSESNREDFNEQIINMSYQYRSDRVSIYNLPDMKTYTHSSYTNLLSNLESNIDVSNTKVDVPVNRLGDYTVLVKAYDSYNNIFVNKSDDYCSIRSKMPDIEIVVNLNYTNNDKNFYSDNIFIEDSSLNAMSPSDTSILFNHVASDIQFPISYKIYSSEHKVEDNIIVYDNISYAIDTPKANDYLLLSNLTDKLTDLTLSGDVVTAKTIGSNIGKQNFKNGNKVALCIFDDNLQKVIWKSEYNMTITSIKNTSNAESTYNGLYQFTITINKTADKDVIPTSYINAVNNKTNNINLYILNISEINISYDDEIINYYDEDGNRRCFIPINNNHSDTHIDSTIDVFEEHYSDDISLRDFPIDTMVKITTSLKENDSNPAEVINETAYRIVDTTIDTSIYNENPTRDTIKCGYVIDGHLDLQFIDSLKNRNLYKIDSSTAGLTIHKYEYINKLYFSMKHLHSHPVQYCLRVNKDAAETVYEYNNSDYYSMNTSVEFNPQQLLFNSYFDDSYAMNIFSFDPIAGKEIWCDKTIIINTLLKGIDNYSNVHLFTYTNHPVTIEQNRIVVVKTKDDNATLCNKIKQFESGHKNIWTWKVKTIEDNSNWNDRDNKFENITLFKSINDMLCVKPYMLGSQSIELECIDKYGNVIRNDGGGNLFVKESSMTY